MMAESLGSGVVENEDEFHQALSNERRRLVLAALRDEEGPLLLTDLARDVVEREPSVEPPTDEAVQRCRISLYHCHLPKLAEAELITFDADRKVTSLTEDGRLVV